MSWTSLPNPNKADALIATAPDFLSGEDRSTRHTGNPVELATQVAMGQFSPDAMTWLSHAFQSYLIDNTPIDRALGLDRASRIRQRDQSLREAARLLRLAGDSTPWPIAERLRSAIKRQAGLRREPRTDIERCIADACASGIRVPTTTRHLYDLIC